MNKAVVTINFNDYLCGNSRDSFQNAAERWGASFVEINEQNCIADVSPYFQKFTMLDLVEADRIFYIDSDAVISEAAPPPFDICPENRLGVVENSTSRMGNEKELKVNERSEISFLSRSCQSDVTVEKYFNSGMMILSRCHHKLLKKASQVASCVDMSGLRWDDQSIINYSAAIFKEPLFLLDEKWNYMWLDQITDWRKMEKYVYHFAGSGDRHTILKSIAWKENGVGDVFSDFNFYIPGSALKNTEFSIKNTKSISFAGRRNGRGEKGFYRHVSYGPYVSLMPGVYTVELNIKETGKVCWYRNFLPKLYVRLTIESGAMELKKRYLFSFCKKSTLTFKIKEKVNYFELLLSSLRDYSFVFKGFSIKKIK